jgi:single-strand DNA-binding protein
MMNETLMTVSGNLVSDVDFRVTPRGDALARFRVASTVTRYDRASGQWIDGDTNYWNVTAWRRAAENAAESLAKGHPVVVHGKVRQRTVDREVAGAPGVTMAVTFTDLEAVSFGLDLTRCRAQYQRAPIGPQTGTADREGRVGPSSQELGHAGGGEDDATDDPRGAATADERQVDAA